MAANSRFFSHIRIWIIAIPIIMVTVMPLVDLDWIYTVSSTEKESNFQLFGDEQYERIEQDTQSQFVNWWMKSGIYQKTLDEHRTGSDSFTVGRPVNGFVNSYFGNLWKMIYRAQYRLHVAYQWLLGGAIFIAAFMFDGWQQRNIKLKTFGYSHPLKFHVVTHAMFLILGFSVTLCFIPMSVTPMFMLTGTTVIAALGWKMMESFQA
ncbi:DUF4400 domain-containing protein [Undibacterium oligocarboniphilum]|uniref:DUF4400 domain-containing protein n=1 Tax=Undibacterium oligocarboniphilum TaxID=666702 RepID=A0A850QNP8_9BURK|nr:DUF4400 domain-containing protein [Undibacterium oligocarboniphilum]MBC3871421.1 DUF4400 domain-containing protein [Undibacterium oligocarboniphilum]NVO79003.1 DUF4400 domain-containing protein [Undibacterium oligocarboniphilum]